MQSILAEMETMKNINSNQDTNILTEQLGEGMRHTHRLELELKRLRQENEDLKLDKFHADANKMLALETENKKLSLTIQQLQVCLTYLDIQLWQKRYIPLYHKPYVNEVTLTEQNLYKKSY